jgi:hypothetical protein
MLLCVMKTKNYITFHLIWKKKKVNIASVFKTSYKDIHPHSLSPNHKHMNKVLFVYNDIFFIIILT